MLRRAGWLVNRKRVARILRRDGLKVPQKQPKKGRLWLNDGSCIRLRLERPHVWSYDFVEDKTHDKRKVRMLNVIDEFTRECLAIRVSRALNATEPGSPLENGYCESFTAKLRDELLNSEIFYSLTEAQVIIESWRQHYNTIRPHSSLAYRPPGPKVLKWPVAQPRPATPASSTGTASVARYTGLSGTMDPLLGHHDFDVGLIASDDRIFKGKLVHGAADHIQKWQDAFDGQAGQLLLALVASSPFHEGETKTCLYVDVGHRTT